MSGNSKSGDSKRGTLSPGYAVGILLSVPAGIIGVMRWAPEGLASWQITALACLPALVVCLAAYLEPRLRR